MSKSYLSRVLSGKVKVSKKLAHKIIAHTPSWTESDRSVFLLLSKKDNASSEKELVEIDTEIEKELEKESCIPDREVELLKHITDIKHFAILEAISLRKLDQNNLANFLGMSPIALSACLDRLVHNGLAKQDDNGRWHRVTSGSAKAFKRPSRIIRKTHTSSIEHAQKAIYTKKHILSRSEVVNIGPDQIEEVRKVCRRMIDEICHLAEDDPKNDSVIHLNLNLFDD